MRANESKSKWSAKSLYKNPQHLKNKINHIYLQYIPDIFSVSHNFEEVLVKFNPLPLLPHLNNSHKHICKSKDEQFYE